MNSRKLPIFPHNLVLFPGATLPLRVWQPGHRKMFKQAVASDRLVGIVFAPSAGESYAITGQPESSPSIAVGSVGCMARVLSAKRVPGRQVRTMVEGVDRFIVDSFELTPEHFVLASVSEHADFVESAGLLDTFAGELRELFARYSDAARAISGERESPSLLPDDPIELSVLLPQLLHLDEETRQRFLASRSPLMRLRELTAILSPAAVSAEEHAKVHVRSGSNGHGTGTH